MHRDYRSGLSNSFVLFFGTGLAAWAVLAVASWGAENSVFPYPIGGAAFVVFLAAPGLVALNRWRREIPAPPSRRQRLPTPFWKAVQGLVASSGTAGALLWAISRPEPCAPDDFECMTVGDPTAMLAFGLALVVIALIASAGAGAVIGMIIRRASGARG
ncbi:hypothetical protein [Rubricoccus marinus]|uniref:Uncharacterized protein n=1 Tax=Rubricoccus marinus TaxID=716817 RepID=A0A259U1W4_9BACT|nr:hypothetical protein [Rubricoccus marinus]OZC03989.1 hypothetical protein BSZ36_13955 [Rubricoccus marinus]